MTDYLIYKKSGELKPRLYGFYAEEDLLLLNFKPGKDLVAIPDVLGADEAEAKRQADMYFRDEHQEPERIDCWVAGALERQKCLKANRPSNRS